MWHVWRLWLAISEQRKYGREMRDLNSFWVRVTHSWLSVPELKSQWREFWLSLSEVCTFQPINSSWRVRLISELGSSNGNHMDGVRENIVPIKKKKGKYCSQNERIMAVTSNESFMNQPRFCGSKKFDSFGYLSLGVGWTSHRMSNSEEEPWCKDRRVLSKVT